jgi:hypothetical protein
MLRTVREVVESLRSNFRLLLDGPSLIPELEASRRAVRANLNHIDQTLLCDIDTFTEPLSDERREELRRFLCVAIGQLNRFLQDSFGSLMAADPRSTHDADYYLSKEFPRDIEEAEWLYDSVTEIDDHLRTLEPERQKLLNEAVRLIHVEGTVMPEERWQATSAYLEILTVDLAPRLRRLVALRGIRLEELELLTHYSNEIPTLCRILSELYQTSRKTVEALIEIQPELQTDGAPNRETETVHRALCERLIPLMRSLDDSLRDLEVFIPLWRRGISQRRALLLHAPPSSSEPDDGANGMPPDLPWNEPE